MTYFILILSYKILCVFIHSFDDLSEKLQSIVMRFTENTIIS